MKFKKVGVLMGGLSRERDVSLASGSAVAKGLRSVGYDVVEIDVDAQIDRQLRNAEIEAAYIALHGRFGEDGTVQGLLELMKIPYTGAGVLASALAMDKDLTRQILMQSGVRVAPGYTVLTPSNITVSAGFSFPLVVKPAVEGSSVGVSIARNTEDYRAALETAAACSHKILVEQFVPGREVQIAIIEDKIIGSVEIETAREFYDYEAKYNSGGSIHHIPARQSGDTIAIVNEMARTTYDAIGCKGAARIDFIVPDAAPTKPIVLEINTIPGMTPTSLLPEIAAHAGIPFEALVSGIMESASLNL